MSVMPMPPEGLVNKLVPLLCRIVGISFVIGGIVALILAPLVFFAKEGETHILALIFVGAAILNISVGISVMRFMPKFMLSRFRKIRENPPF